VRTIALFSLPLRPSPFPRKLHPHKRNAPLPILPCDESRRVAESLANSLLRLAPKVRRRCTSGASEANEGVLVCRSPSFAEGEDAQARDTKEVSHSFGRSLSPGHCRRKNALPVSYYALFQGSLLLSKPPGCFSILTSFST
jgi:hypothetical protein